MFCFEVYINLILCLTLKHIYLHNLLICVGFSTVTLCLSLGSLNHLLTYETERQRHNLPVLATIDGLQRLYSTDFTPLVMARSLGLTAVNSLTSLKVFVTWWWCGCVHLLHADTLCVMVVVVFRNINHERYLSHSHAVFAFYLLHCLEMFPLNVLCCPLEHCAVQKCVPWKIFATGLQRACMMMIVVQKKKIPWKVFFPHLHYACIMIVQFRDIFLTSVTRSQDICMALTA